ncbi:MAG: hypothetical protein ABI383_04160 [Acidobacteriaceae bacterium]
MVASQRPDGDGMPAIVVLHVGIDSTLLTSRSEVLRRAGFIIVPTASVAEAMRIFLSGDFDMVIVCHSTSAAERRALVNLVHSHSSSVPVVLVTMFPEQDFIVDAVVDNEPKELARELARVLDQYGPPHKIA